jgi:hypothetical protein
MNNIYREQKKLSDQLLYEKKCIEAQKIVARKWRGRNSRLRTRAQFEGLISANRALILKEKADEETFLQQMNVRMLQEQQIQLEWQNKNKHVVLSRRRRGGEGNCLDPALELLLQSRRQKKLSADSSCLEQKWNNNNKCLVKVGAKQQQSARAVALDPHIEALMNKYGKPSDNDDHTRKKRFFDIQL